VREVNCQLLGSWTCSLGRTAVIPSHVQLEIYKGKGLQLWDVEAFTFNIHSIHLQVFFC